MFLCATLIQILKILKPVGQQMRPSRKMRCCVVEGSCILLEAALILRVESFWKSSLACWKVSLFVFGLVLPPLWAIFSVFKTTTPIVHILDESRRLLKYLKNQQIKRLFSIMDRKWWYSYKIWAFSWTVIVIIENGTVEHVFHFGVWNTKTAYHAINLKRSWHAVVN